MADKRIVEAEMIVRSAWRGEWPTDPKKCLRIQTLLGQNGVEFHLTITRNNHPAYSAQDSDLIEAARKLANLIYSHPQELELAK